MNQIISSPSVVEVEWIDAHSQGGPEWVNAEDAYDYAHSELPKIKQVGFILYEDDNVLAITDTLGIDVTGTVHSIPKGMIVARVEMGSYYDNNVNRQ